MNLANMKKAQDRLLQNKRFYPRSQHVLLFTEVLTSLICLHKI